MTNVRDNLNLSLHERAARGASLAMLASSSDVLRQGSNAVRAPADRLRVRHAGVFLSKRRVDRPACRRASGGVGLITVASAVIVAIPV